MLTIQQHSTTPVRPGERRRFGNNEEGRGGRVEMKCEYLDLTRLAREVTAEVASVNPSHPLTFEGDGACPLHGDRSALRRMIQNLLENAMRSSTVGREVRISVWRRGADIWLSAEDQGLGVSASLTERSFRPFLRLDSETGITAANRAYLAPVRRIVEAHGAEICLQGDADHGTTIEIRFKASFNKE